MFRYFHPLNKLNPINKLNLFNQMGHLVPMKYVFVQSKSSQSIEFVESNSQIKFFHSSSSLWNELDLEEEVKEKNPIYTGLDLNKALTPKGIVQELDRYVVGQSAAKRAVANALRNRWRRHQLDPKLRDEVIPKNILMIGPTGSGKTVSILLDYCSQLKKYILYKI